MSRGAAAALLLALACMRAEAQTWEPKGRCASGLPRGEFGSAVAVGDNGLIAAGDYRNDVVYLFQVTSDGCRETSRMQGSSGEWFGFSLAIEGELLLVGAPKAGGTGAAYLVSFTDEGVFGARRQLFLPGVRPGDEAGSSVAISGVTLAVGARGADDRRGRVYAGTEGGLAAVPSPSGLAPRAELGQSVALSGTTLVMGAPSPYRGSGLRGAAYVYRLGSGVSPEAVPLPAGLGTESAFGYAVAVEDGTILIGAPLADVNGADSGAVFRCSEAGCERVLSGSRGDQLGVAVALDGGTALIGARYFDGRRGAAYLVKLAGGRQDLHLLVTVPANAQLGFAVAVHEDIAVVGAFQEGGTGTAYVFEPQEESEQPCQEPAIVLSDQGPLETSEDGDFAELSFRLSCLPAADVKLALSTSDGSEGAVSPASLTFTAADWSSPKTVRVTGRDDPDCDGDQAYSVRVRATNVEPNDQNFPIPATNADDERACLSAVQELCVDGDGTVVYTITLSGAVEETAARLMDQLPPDVAAVFASADRGVATVDYAGNSVQWSGPVSPDTGVTITIVAALDPVPPGAEVRNQATITYDRDGRGHFETVETNPTVFAAGQTPCDSPPPP